MSKCLLGDSLFDQFDPNQIERKKDWRSIIKKNVSRQDGPLRLIPASTKGLVVFKGLGTGTAGTGSYQAHSTGSSNL